MRLSQCYGGLRKVRGHDSMLTCMSRYSSTFEYFSKGRFLTGQSAKISNLQSALKSHCIKKCIVKRVSSTCWPQRSPQNQGFSGTFAYNFAKLGQTLDDAGPAPWAKTCLNDLFLPNAGQVEDGIVTKCQKCRGYSKVSSHCCVRLHVCPLVRASTQIFYKMNTIVLVLFE